MHKQFPSMRRGRPNPAALQKILNPEQITATCKICNIEVEQWLDYHAADKCGFSYRCGCISRHTSNPDQSFWLAKDGTELLLPTKEV